MLAALEDLELVPANRNAAGQIVAAGRLDALAKLAENPPEKARVVHRGNDTWETHYRTPADELHASTVDWATQQAESFARYMQQRDPSFTADRGWPIREARTA